MQSILTRTFAPATATQMDAALLVVRVLTGIILAAHGWQKVFTSGMAGVADNFAKMGIPLASAAGPFVSMLELVGGIALVMGLFTRPIAFMVAINMLVAALLVHSPNGLTGRGGMELTLLLAAAAAALTLTGAGRWSADALLGSKAQD